MDPKFKDINLATEKQITASEFIHQLSENVREHIMQPILSELAEHRAQEGFFFRKNVRFEIS